MERTIKTKEELKRAKNDGIDIIIVTGSFLYTLNRSRD